MRKQVTVQVRLNDADKALVREAAERAGLSVSEWVRRALWRRARIEADARAYVEPQTD